MQFNNGCMIKTGLGQNDKLLMLCRENKYCCFVSLLERLMFNETSLNVITFKHHKRHN